MLYERSICAGSVLGLKVLFGIKYKVPVILDIRDLWPDIFYSRIPVRLHFIGKIILFWQEFMANWSIKNSNGFIGISEGYLSWAQKRSGRIKEGILAPLGYSENLLNRKIYEYSNNSGQRRKQKN